MSLSQRSLENSIIPVILSGGGGTRLWPVSRERRPKPFMKLGDGQSLIQKAWTRASSIPGVREILLVTNEQLLELTQVEFRNMPNSKCDASFILEPFGRNSAPAIALAAHYLKQKYDEKAMMIILTADHLIADERAFHHAVKKAIELAKHQKLVTFGITPESPNTGFGYIQANETEVVRFVEKPDLAAAIRYLEDGNYLWNSGMFCMQPSVFLNELQALASDIFEDTSKCILKARRETGKEGGDILHIHSDDFALVRHISIDYAVFEKSQNVAVVPASIGWTDVGSWLEFGQLLPRDDQGNHIYGELVLESVSDCIFYSKRRLIAALHVNNLAIIETDDALLVADKAHLQKVKNITEKIKQKKVGSDDPDLECDQLPCEVKAHTQVDHASVQSITLSPGETFKPEQAHQRTLLMNVVKGRGTVLIDGKECKIAQHSQFSVPPEKTFLIKNLGDSALEMVQVQGM